MAMLTTMTTDTHERDHIIFTRNIFLIVVAVGVNMGFSLLTSAEVGMSMSTAVSIFSIILLILMLPMIFQVKEHVVVSEVKEEKEKLNIVESLKCVLSNRNLLSHYSGAILMDCLATTTVVGTFASYYLFGSTLFTIITMVPPMIVKLIVM